MICKHERVKKMIYQFPKGSWQTTPYYFCVDCKMVVMHKSHIPAVMEAMGVKEKHEEAERNLSLVSQSKYKQEVKEKHGKSKGSS